MIALLTVLFTLWLAGPAAAQDEDARQQWADDNFEAVMMQNAAAPAKPVAPAAAERLNSLGYAADTPAATTPPPAPPSAPDARVTLPLERYEGALKRLEEAAEADLRATGPLVVLGASTYTGRAVEGALSLRLSLQVTLAGPGRYKTVPLVGEDVVVVSASQGGRPIALSRSNGYHVWVTQQTGEVSLSLDLLVPARGPRGSLEYDFLVARTPVTRLSCAFSSEGLDPRLRRAVRAEVRAAPGGTLLDAWLEPTSRVHLVGYRAASDEEKREARVYAESLSLLSVSEDTSEIFTVLRYNILHAGAQRFDISIPAGLTVVSADGEGAFRYTVETSETGSLLRGETAFPIRDRYEVSLRLRRAEAPGETLDVRLPHAVGVERESGWLAVEVTGNLKLEELSRANALAVDVRQLPSEMVESAVSPVLRAWRYYGDQPEVRLSSARLPEKEPASASIDRVNATTVVSAEGRAYTDLQITLRNRLRHSLALRLPEGVEVRSTLLDGAPVKPSRDAGGALLLPLQRSGGGDDPDAFTLQLVLDSDLGALWIFGLQRLALPELELPVSSLQWSVWLPGANVYSRLEGEVQPQQWAGAARWYQPPVSGYAGLFALGGEVGPSGLAGAGAMPVRIELPHSGRELSYRRYWVPEDRAVEVHFWYLRRWLEATLGGLAALTLILGLARRGAVWRAPGRTRATRLLSGAALAAALAWWRGFDLVILCAALGLGALALREGWPRRALAGAKRWWTSPAETATEGGWASRSLIGRLALVLGFLGVAWLWSLLAMRAGWVLLRPLGG